MSDLVFHSGFETGDFSEWGLTGGAVTVITGGIGPKTGDYCMRCNPVPSDAYVRPPAASISQGRVNFNIYIASTPDGQCTILGFTGVNGSLRLNTDRTLELYDGSTSRGSSAAALNEGQWYRICYAFDSGNNATIYIDGADSINTGSASTTLTLNFGVVFSNVTTDLYFDDYSYDETDSEADLGDIRVQVALPIGNGNQNDYDFATGWELCDNLPDDTDWVLDQGTGEAREQFTLNTMSDLGISSATPEAVNVIIRLERGGGGGGNTHSISVRDNSTNFETATAAIDAWTQYSKYYAALPSGGGPWTEARFDALEAGCYHSGSQDSYCSTVNVMLAYTVVAAAPSEKPAIVFGANF